MTWILATHIVQLIAGFAWGLVAVALFPQFWRALTKSNATVVDILAGQMFFNGVVQACYTLRWIIFPNAITTMGGLELLYWGGLYATSTLVAGVVLWGHFVIGKAR